MSVENETISVDCPPGSRGFILMCVNNDSMRRDRMAREWIDNSLDAKSSMIIISRNERSLEIRDDGIGCARPLTILQPSRSHIHEKGPRSGMFGMGGKMASMRASRGQRTHVETVHNGIVHQADADWKAMMDRDDWKMQQFEPSPASSGQKGTLIRNTGPAGPITFPGAEKIASRLGFDYADVLRDGVSITLKIDGKRYEVRPYCLPKFVDRVDFKFEYNGSAIDGFCGLVANDEPNPYPGWTFHWGPHRVLLTTEDPANGKFCRRIQGHVNLPSDWANINVTKDGFGDEDPTELLDQITQACQAIIDSAQEASDSYELSTFTKEVESLLDGTILVRANGRRPGNSGQSGTINPKDSGKKHRKFNVWKPGDRGVARSQPSIPQRFEVHWLESIENSWHVNVTGNRTKVAHITLNPSRPIIGNLRKTQNTYGVFVVCAQALAIHLRLNRDLQGCFGFSELGEVHEIFDVLTGGNGADTQKAAV